MSWGDPYDEVVRRLEPKAFYAAVVKLRKAGVRVYRTAQGPTVWGRLVTPEELIAMARFGWRR